MKYVSRIPTSNASEAEPRRDGIAEQGAVSTKPTPPGTLHALPITCGDLMGYSEETRTRISNLKAKNVAYASTRQTNVECTRTDCQKSIRRNNPTESMIRRTDCVDRCRAV